MNIEIKHLLFYSKSKWVIATLVFVIFTGFVGDSCLIRRYENNMEISRLSDEIEFYKNKYETDKATLERFKSDPEAVVEVARKKYYMKTRNEDIFIIEEKNDKE
ncbi:MAG: septum formation initiator family protein [Bacteroidaceae bacterium]|nr:septum formation initiator family protein [Bacteroidaceae bacterium]